jgi:CubicO group peptidase (beta-lactamase class C family)
MPLAALPPLPPQPRGVPWPTESWPEGALEATGGASEVEEVAGDLFAPATAADIGETRALLIIQNGRLVLERYAPGFGPDATCHSWSMAKSITHALVGLCVASGRLVALDRSPGVPEWSAKGDPRRDITLGHLMHMASGLEFIEDYIPGHVSDVIEMLFGSGRPDTAAYAAAKPLVYEPGVLLAYASGTTNIISRSLGCALGAKGPAFEAFMRERLFDPLGMNSPIPKFDAAGTFIGSSYCFCTPRDFARFGLLYLRDGVWNGLPLLPEGWVEHARTPSWRQPGSPDGRYGAHWWLDFFSPGGFSANGYDGQYVILRPDRDLIVVRNGLNPLAASSLLQGRLKALVGLFD